MKILRSKVERTGIPWDELQPGETYMEVGYDGDGDIIYLATTDDKLVDLADGEAFEGTDFEEDTKFVVVAVNLLVEK